MPRKIPWQNNRFFGNNLKNSENVELYSINYIQKNIRYDAHYTANTSVISFNNKTCQFKYIFKKFYT